MKDFQTIDDTIKLKKIWPAIIEHGSLQIQRAIDPHREFLERVFDGCWLETKYLPESANACSATARYSLENGKTYKVLGAGVKFEADFNGYVFFAELVLRERYRKYGYGRQNEYARGPELDRLLRNIS